jgi:hypothetical protein
MHVACLKRRQSYASFRLEVFQLLFLPSKPALAPRIDLRNSREQHRHFGSSTISSKQRGSRNIKRDAEIPDSVEAQLVHGASKSPIVRRTPAPPHHEPTKKQGSSDETRQWSPYRQDVQDDLKALLRDLKVAASEAEQFEQEFFENLPKGAEVQKTEAGESPILSEEYASTQPIALRPDYRVPRPSHDLPESPVMRRLQKEKKHKRMPTEEELSALSNNPWASILASPVRFCQGTGVRLPSDLLVPWSFVTKRSTDTTYLMPAALADLKKLKSLGDFKKDSETSEESKGDNPGRAPDFNAVPRITKLMGKTNILPYQPLIQKLTDRMIPRGKTGTRVGAVQSILSLRVKTAFSEVQHYAKDQEERKRMDLKSLQWQHDIPSRMMDIMKERVLTALESLGTLNENEQTIVPVPVQALETGRMVVLFGPAGDEAQPLKHSFKAAEAMPEPSPKVPHRKLAQLIHDRFAGGSFLLHVNSPPVAIPDQPSVVLSRTIPNLIPQTISLNNPIRCPVFNLQQLLGSSDMDGTASKHVELRYKQVLRSSKVLDVPRLNSNPVYRNLKPALGKGGQPLTVVQDENSRNGPAYLLFVEAGAPLAKVLAREVWQLWRYMGGSLQERKTTVGTEVGSEDLEEIVDELDELDEADDAGMDLGHSASTVWRDGPKANPISISA